MSRKPTSRGPGEQAQQHYLIEPRALAGGGDLRHVSEFLRASGWRDKSKTGGPLVMESPERAVRISYDPYVLPGGWTIHGRAIGQQEEWWAVLGRQTPVEIVAGLTDALSAPRSAHAPNAWAPLQEQDWQTGPEGGHYTATSPDGSARLQYHEVPGGQPMWWAEAKDGQGNGWSAQFTASTPMHLVQAFSTALSSPEPVMRPLGRVPQSTQIRTTSVSVLPSQLSAWQQSRIAAARAATWARNTARGNRPRTTARPHAHAGGTRTRR
ncbi:DUF317 domain-containing protein [Streptomyces sp. H10-C2]|uniref:DUF317 domain-containing protein n=1 Tax=unclassified Streptomyces TaxID=2593676 RepID=UPI0022AE88D0|nr:MULTISPECIES: DUF317 domain-containing protein [unclassified Streptomyces]MCZ4103659.1 DUF317 domain-containing protein [Streptomyces sp. H39-C1]MDJ0347170.1 DUF317 domain-containing protein [Streptomyces sp. PH10-H1]MDJ0375429.1 DUF317 domain-containing protein [Streptomyces sp. H10-C2]